LKRCIFSKEGKKKKINKRLGRARTNFSQRDHVSEEKKGEKQNPRTMVETKGHHYTLIT